MENLQLSNAPRKPQSNPYLKPPQSTKTIGLFDVTDNRMYVLATDDEGRYIETGKYRTIDKPKETVIPNTAQDKDNTVDLLQEINVEDLDGISQPGYSYEENKSKRENEESEQGNMNGSISTTTQGLPKIITTQEQVNLLVRKDKTQPFTPTNQETEYIEKNGNETTEGENPELKQSNEQY
jgi:transglutaminase/protease-like cytokinesis protein 3